VKCDKGHSELVGHHLLDLVSTGKDCAISIYTRRLLPLLDTVHGRRRPTTAIADVEFSGIDLPETQSMQSSGV
jgi:hypothetical protein